jgi:hypothetical protein
MAGGGTRPSMSDGGRARSSWQQTRRYATSLGVRSIHVKSVFRKPYSSSLGVESQGQMFQRHALSIVVHDGGKNPNSNICVLALDALPRGYGPYARKCRAGAHPCGFPSSLLLYTFGGHSLRIGH